MTGFEPVPDVRLIERWLPIAEIGVESTRARTPTTPLPALSRLHVWWAMCPLVASRGAVLETLLPGGVDRIRFLPRLLIRIGKYFAGQRGEA